MLDYLVAEFRVFHYDYLGDAVGIVALLQVPADLWVRGTKNEILSEIFKASGLVALHLIHNNLQFRLAELDLGLECPADRPPAHRRRIDRPHNVIDFLYIGYISEFDQIFNIEGLLLISIQLDTAQLDKGILNLRIDLINLGNSLIHLRVKSSKKLLASHPKLTKLKIAQPQIPININRRKQLINLSPPIPRNALLLDIPPKRQQSKLAILTNILINLMHIDAGMRPVELVDEGVVHLGHVFYCADEGVVQGVPFLGLEVDGGEGF